MDEAPSLLRACVTCGRWMPLQEGSAQVYCSPECSRENQCCSVCSRYFEVGTGVEGPESVVFCSSECADVHVKYHPMFKETP